MDSAELKAKLRKKIHEHTAKRRKRSSSESDGDELDDNPIRTNIAGVPCIAFTPIGSNDRDLDPSEIYHHVWLTERRTLAEQNREDLWMGECVTQYPVESRMVPHVNHVQTVIYIHDGPTQRRYRMMDAGVNRETMRWVGPSPED
eukprot:8996233-Pyramimonas_sp.AAC.1